MKKKNRVIGTILATFLLITILFFTNVNFAANTAKVNVETANMRETADENSKILKQLSLNDNVEVIDDSNTWCQVKSGDVTGYVRKDLITMNVNSENTNTESNNTTENKDSTEKNEAVSTNTQTSSNQETTSSEKLTGEQTVNETTKLKIIPLINATDIVEVKKDEKVTALDEINGWVYVQDGTIRGWIRKDKLVANNTAADTSKTETTTQDAQTTNTTAANVTTENTTPIKTAYIKETSVNLRKEANTTSEIVNTLTQNTSVEVYSEANGWSKVKVNGEEGYISTSLLSDSRVKVTTNTNNTTSRSATTERKSTTTETKKAAGSTANTATTASSGKGATVVETAKKYLGSKYVYGAAGPNAFDCSGFTQYIYKLHGISLNRTAQAQFSNGSAVSKGNLQSGDLVMFGSSASNISHVGIYIGGGQIIHASTPSTGVRTDTINSGYYSNKYVGARRVM